MVRRHSVLADRTDVRLTSKGSALYRNAEGFIELYESDEEQAIVQLLATAPGRRSKFGELVKTVRGWDTTRRWSRSMLGAEVCKLEEKGLVKVG